MDLTTKIGKTVFKNPVWVASGTFGYGKEFEDFFDIDSLGAVVTKTVTKDARSGNMPPRVVETASGLLNSIGLENKGVKNLAEEYMPFLRKLDTRVVISIAGETEEELVSCAEELEKSDGVDAIELNLSCPNVSHGSAKYSLIAQDADATARMISAVRKATSRLLIAKLTPNVTDVAGIAVCAESAGADAVSLVNTYFGMAVDASEKKPLLGNVTGGLSGPAIKPMALKAVWDVYNAVRIPVVGIGGITSGRDAAEFMLCGASAVQAGTWNFVDPAGCVKILSELTEYLESQGLERSQDLVGRLEV